MPLHCVDNNDCGSHDTVTSVMEISMVPITATFIYEYKQIAVETLLMIMIIMIIATFAKE